MNQLLCLIKILKMMLMKLTDNSTEDNKKPDFLFPGKDAYLNPKFDDQ